MSTETREPAAMTPELAVVERGPGLTPYRARKRPELHTVESYDERLLILATRTHDEDAWYQAAVDLHAAHERREHLFSRTGWVRLVPWGGDGGSWQECQPADRSSVPCVWYEPELPR